MKWCYLFLLSCLITISLCIEDSNSESKAVALYKLRNTLLISTIDGTLRAVDSETGVEKWALYSQEPFLASTQNPAGEDPVVIPGVDGSIYVADGPNKGTLHRLPLSAREIVEATPFRTSDIWYIGKKETELFVVDEKSGHIKKMLVPGSSTDGADGSQCPSSLPDGEFVFLGRTRLTIMAVDSVTFEQRWNASVGEYLSYSGTPADLDRYNLPTLVSTTDGTVSRVEPDTKALIWSLSLGAPISAAHVVDEHSDLIRIPHIYVESEGTRNRFIPHDQDQGSSVYVGCYSDGQLYALSASMDESTTESLVAMSHKLDMHASSGSLLNDHLLPSPNIQSDIFGFHETINQPLTLPIPEPESPANTTDTPDGIHPNTGSEGHRYVITGIVIFTTIAVTALIYVIKKRPSIIVSPRKAKRKKKRGNTPAKRLPKIGSTKVKSTEIVGRITIYSRKILGKGSHGTIVYEGLFEDREVAIKRLSLPFYDDPAREIALLIASDDHPNIVKYYAKEETQDFLYLALERCQCNLAAAVHEEVLIGSPLFAQSPSNSHLVVATPVLITLLKCAVSGVARLHSLEIVHRDIKPQNILLKEDPNVGVICKIADMGLGKRLEAVQSFYTHVGSCAGTSGWQAPEMLVPGGRLTKAVDVFSLGCLIYYALTRGSHAFGEFADYNISIGKADLRKLKHDPEAQALITDMIVFDPADRISAIEALNHPFFWSDRQKLQFLLESSDRIESEDMDTVLKATLEYRAQDLVSKDWDKLLDARLLENLGKYRKYDFSSVRDLLRVIRNKANHHGELPSEVRLTLGALPLDEDMQPHNFFRYFATRFPMLLMHTYRVMIMCRNECKFDKYYGHLSEHSQTKLLNEVTIPCRCWWPPWYEHSNTGSIPSLPMLDDSRFCHP